MIERQQSAAKDDRFTSIVLMTDGESNEGASAEDFKSVDQGLPASGRVVPVFPICSGTRRRDSCRGSRS